MADQWISKIVSKWVIVGLTLSSLLVWITVITVYINSHGHQSYYAKHHVLTENHLTHRNQPFAFRSETNDSFQERTERNRSQSPLNHLDISVNENNAASIDDILAALDLEEEFHSN